MSAAAERWAEPICLDASGLVKLRARTWKRRAEPRTRGAERLMLSLEVPLRALDALHLATALDAGAVTVVTFDPRMREAAATQGLFVAPPEAA